MTRNPHHTPPSTVDETIATIREHCQALAVEQVPLDQAARRVIREPVRADTDQPPFDRSAVDGYAVRREDRSASFRIVDRLRAGDWKPRELQPGEAVQIATGGALPCDGLQVVMKEDARVEADRLVVVQRDDARHIRFRGEDASAGAVLIQPGTVARPGVLALMASVGCARPRVTRLPRVLHLATGNEIVAPDRKPERGQIRDSNTTLVRAFLGQFGITPEQMRVSEDRASIQSAIRNPQSALGRWDLLLVSGGASVGEHDFTRSLLEEAGYSIHVQRTTTRPGKPMIFGSRDGSVAFGLPGNPLAHFVCLHLYVRQALWRFSGATDAPDFCVGVLAADFAAEANERETLWPARTEMAEGEVRLTLLRWQSSGDLTSLSAANALVRIPPNAGPLSRGFRLFFLPI
ncbi:MAG: molybdopterin molybdotransferase MoeA [Verrucomicrobia bacterium]|nr:molybdopterin molybdotransferase MoeA [Verrucomicrobiota bacterium]